MTASEYIEAVERLAALAPGNALLNWLRGNQSVSNEILLIREIEKAEAENDQKNAAEDASRADHAADDPEDEPLKTLRRQQAELFGKRRRESNRFHDCRSDAERAAVSESVQAIQREITVVMGRISARKIGSSGAAPTVGLPTDALGIHRKILSLRASISRKKGQIETLRATASPKLADAEKKLADLKNDLETAEKLAKRFAHPEENTEIEP